MPRYDQQTVDFMRQFIDDETPPSALKIAEEKKDPSQPEESHAQLTTKPIRTIKQIVKGIEHPDRALGKMIVRVAAHALMEKEGYMKILDIYRFMNEHYKREWWDWEPETLWATLESDHLTNTPDELKEAIGALQVTLNTFAPFEHWHVFEKVGHAFNMNPVLFSVVQPLELDEIALTIHVLGKIRPNTEYDSEILQYIACQAKHSGVVWLPEEFFPGCQKYLDEITFEHGLRDSVSKMWGNPKGGVPKAKDVTKDHLEIQIGRLLDVKRYLVKEVGLA